MKIRNQVELTKEEKQAIKNCIEAIECDEVGCSECPFNYSNGCMLEYLRAVAED